MALSKRRPAPTARVHSASTRMSALREKSANREPRRLASPARKTAATTKKKLSAPSQDAATAAAAAAAGAELLGQLQPQHRDIVRLLYREFTQQVRFAASVPMNRGKCEGFLREYSLFPGAKQAEHLMTLLLEDIHHVESVFNAHPSPAKPRAASPAKRKGIFSTCAPCGLPAFVSALRWLAVRRKEPAADGASQHPVLPLAPSLSTG